MVEAALVFPLVMLLIFGILEGALEFRTYLSASSASNNAARVGSIDGRDSYTDYDILQAIGKGAPGISQNQIQDMIVYKATAPGAGPSATCIDHALAHGDVGVSGECNVYKYSDMQRPKSDFGPGGFGADQYWAPSTRSESLSAGTDYLGVWVHMQCQCLSSAFFGITPQLHSTTVIQLEPQVK